jgi:RecB family exonuclease
MLLDVLDGVIACGVAERAAGAQPERAGVRPAVVTAFGDDRAERLLLGPIGGGDPVYLRRLRRVLRQLDPTEFGCAPAVLDPLGANVLPDHVRRPVQRVANVVEAGRAALAQGTAEDVLWAIWERTGLARRWEEASRGGGLAGAAADRDLDAVVELFATAARFVDRLPQATAEQFAEHLAAQQLPGDATLAPSGDVETVSVLTAHASKGLEWELVCVAAVQEGTWPNLRRRGSLLGSEVLVDALSGQDAPGVSQTARQLAEERRLFYVAVTRARQRVVVSAVSGEEEQPSRFLDELDPLADDRPYGVIPKGVHLPSVVAELRAVVTEPGDARRAEAATALARLAGAGVPGADPAQWWGLAGLSDDRPMSDPGTTITVSPSKIESFLKCELRALLEDLGARDGNLVSASLGTLVHAIAAARPDATAEELERLLDEHWNTIDFGAPWFSINERLRAGGFITRLAGWLTSSRAELELVAVEEAFSVELDDVQLRGRVDRLERDRQGRLVVVDLKTGKTKPSAADIPEHPQLGAYQLAVELGGFTEVNPSQVPGGAMLVQLASTGDAVQAQEALADNDNPAWARETVTAVAAVLRGASFRATLGPDCRHCGVRMSCPLQPEGRGVVE